MRSILHFLLLCLAFTAHAKEWKSDLFHCAANIPDGNGWQMIDAPPVPGLAPVLVMQNTSRQAVFGISIVEKYHDANLADPKIQMELEDLLRQFGYQFVGHANVNAGGLSWLQYPVRSGTGQQQVSALIRFASAGGYVFSITMLRGGGQEASQDVELQQAAASFRMLPATAVTESKTPASASPAGTSERPPEKTAAKKAGSPPGIPSSSDEDEAAKEDNSNARMIWAGGAALVVLVIFFGIISKKPSK